MNKLILCISMLVLTMFSCSTTKTLLKTDCSLDFDSNSITGGDSLAKEFYIPRKFLPRLIENLLVLGKKPPIEYKDFSNKTKREDKYAGYHIVGCADTTWAKQTMANHLMEKYFINRYDSMYYDTVYTIEAVDESKINYSNDSCVYTMGPFLNFNNKRYHVYKCVPWGSLCHSLIPWGMNKKTNTVRGKSRKGLFDIKIPSDLYNEEGFEAYQNYLLDSLGISMTVERIDTITLGVYTSTR